MGTDYPADMGSGDPVAWVRQIAGLSDGDKKKILEDNVKPLLKTK